MSNHCVNLSSPELKKIVEETGLHPLDVASIISNWQDENNTDEFPKRNVFNKNVNTIDAMPKASNIIFNNLSKVISWFKNIGNKDVFWNKIQKDLGIPKEQVELFKNSKGNTIEEKLTSFAANYSYAVEINPTKEKNEDRFTLNGVDYFGNEIDNDYRKGVYGNLITKEEYNNAKNEYFKNNKQLATTSYYSNLTVPGGTNYTENEIATPTITPSIKGHAQFATDQGIGWFRSDEQTKEGTGRIDEWDDDKNQKTVQNFVGGEATKTRRILEVQSDLFQKGRDKKDLITKEPEHNYTAFPTKLFKNNKVGDIVQYKGAYYKLTEKYLDEIDVFNFNNQGDEDLEMFKIERVGAPIDSKNQFLQLLNQGSNWVTFFVKSIIQDSSKKGYEKVLFPSGNTASKVEGHTTLEEFKKQKEDRLKELDEAESTVIKKEDKSDPYDKPFKVIRNGVVQTTYKTRDEAEKEAYNLNSYIITERSQLKQELERVEKEGFAALKPIFNFYENTVANILKKQGYTPKQVTDEYGNTWNEVEITDKNKERVFFQEGKSEPSDFYNKYPSHKVAWSKRNEERIRLESEFPGLKFLMNGPNQGLASFQVIIDRSKFQESNKGLKKTESDEEIISKVKTFLQSIGVTHTNVDNIKDQDGNPTSAVAVAKMVSKIIEVVEGRADVTTLTEEAAHFFVDMLKDNQLLEKMISDIDKYQVYNEVKNSEFYKSKYNGDDRLIRIEAVGKQIVKSIINQQAENNEVLESTFKRFWNNIVNKLKALFKKSDPKIKNSLYDIAGRDILSSNTSKLDIGVSYRFETGYGETGNSLAILFDNKKVGNINYSIDNNVATIDAVEIDEKYRGMGLSTDAYRKIGVNLLSKGISLASGELNSSSIKTWESLVEQGYAEKTGNKFKFVKNNEQFFYQANEQQTKITENLDNKFTISLNEDKVNSKTGKKGVYELLKNGVITPVLNRVSDVVEAVNKKRGFAERTDKQKAQDDVRRVIGIKGHSDINNIIARIVEEINGVSTTQRVQNLDTKSYNELEVFMKNFIKEFPAGSKFYTEKTIYDEQKNEAGTVDLLVVLPDGKTDIYDWKFVEFKRKDSKGKIIDKSVAWYKEENYNVQLTRYRQILRSNYGVKEFGKSRIIPISALYKNDKLQSLEIGNKKIDGLDKPYLDPIPLTGLKANEIERTGDEKIDEMLDVLLQQRDRILNKVEYTAEGKLKKAERLERINNSIKKLQIEGDIKSFLDDAVFELNYITNVGIANLNNDDLVVAKALVDYYSDLHKHRVIPSDQALKYKEVLAKVTLNAQDIYGRITDEYENRIEKVALSQGVDNIDELQPETGLLSKLFNTISQINHPIVKTFYRLVMRQKDKIYNDTKILNKKIEDSIKDLEKWASNKGLKGLNMFDGMLQFKDGKKTGKLINRWDPKYYEEKGNAIANKDYKWFSENVDFDSEKYEEYLKRNQAVWSDLYKGDVDGERKMEARVEEYRSKYDPRYSNSALVNSSNRFLHPKESWRSKEWKNLQSPENKPLKDFYDLFTSTINDFREHLPIDLNGNFIPNIKNDLMDQIMANGLSSVQGLGESIISSLRAESSESIGMIDEITGEKVKSIPLLFTREIGSENKSYDLGKVLSLFGGMAYNYKYMSEIESSAEMLKDVLSSQKQTVVTSDGKTLKSKVTDKVAAYLGSSETLDQFNDFMNFYIYGIKSTQKSTTFKFLGNELSTEKVFSSTMKYYVTKALSLNLLPASANLFGGHANAFFEGVKGRFYTNSQYKKALGMMSIMNKNAFAAIEYFDIEGVSSNFKKANKLSVSAVTRNMTMDKFHILQQGGDYTVENGVLLAVMQSHTIRDGKIVKLKDGEKSLMDMIDTSNDKFEIPGLTEEEFHKFRRKVKSLYGSMKGNSNQDDISTIKLTVLGQAVMMFRGWIPRMANERFGDLKHVGDLEVWEMGKYKSFYNQTFNKQIIPNILRSLSAGGVLGIGANSINSKAVTQKAIQIYNEMLAKNPDLKITQDEFIELHKQNLRSSAMELQMILLLTMLLAGLKGGDDDDKDPQRKVAGKLIKRYVQELSFFIDPSSTGSLLKKPIPILSLGTDITGFIDAFAHEGYGDIVGDEKISEKAKPLRYVRRLFPVTSALENFWQLTDPDYNKKSE